MTKKASILIVEDEPIIADDIALTLEELGYEVVGIADGAPAALHTLGQTKADLILLDINLKGDIDGVQLAHKINEAFQIPFVFVSSLYDTTTLSRARNTAPAGYIVKPFKESDLQVNVELALSKQAIQQTKNDESNPLHLFVRKDGAILPLQFEDVLYVEADDNYAVFHAGSDRHVVSQTLKQVAEKLREFGFHRIHKTYLVNIKKVDRIEHSVVFIGEKMLPIGKVYRNRFFDQLTIL